MTTPSEHSQVCGNLESKINWGMDTLSRCLWQWNWFQDSSSQINEKEKVSTERFKISQKQGWETYFAIAIKASLLASAKLTSSGEIIVTFLRPSKTWKNRKIDKSKAFFILLNLDMTVKWVQACMTEPGRQQRLNSHQEWPGQFSLPLDQCPRAKG